MSNLLTDAQRKELLSPLMSVDSFFLKYASKFLRAELTEKAYAAAESFFLENNPNKKDIADLKQRLDSRSIPEFARQVLSHSQKESFLVMLFKAEMECLGHAIEIEDYGINNGGRFIGRTDKSVQKSDYLISVDGGPKKPYEVKNSPSARKCTFKVNNLKSYLSQNASIILFYGTGRLEDDCSKIDRKNTKWAVLSCSAIKSLLEREQKIYWEVGNKLGVQILKDEFDKYFKSRSLRSL